MNLLPSQLDMLLHCGLIERAFMFAEIAHKGQTRSSGEPYFNHPCRVVRLIESYGYFGMLTEVRCVGYLHDTVEDCEVSEDLIKELFGDEIARGVMQLTNKCGNVPFTQKHALLLNHCRHMDMPFKWVKLADRMDNLTDAERTWKPRRTKRYAKAAYELVQALMPWPNGDERLAADLMGVIYSIIPPEEIEAYQIVNDVKE